MLQLTENFRVCLISGFGKQYGFVMPKNHKNEKLVSKRLSFYLTWVFWFFFFFFLVWVLFCLFRAVPEIYGSSQGFDWSCSCWPTPQPQVLSHVRDLDHSSPQLGILNPQSKARDWTHALMDTIRFVTTEPLQGLLMCHLNKSFNSGNPQFVKIKHWAFPVYCKGCYAG